MMNRINWTELKPQIQQVGRLSLPAILTQITTIAMQYIDSAMVGALGANASAAIGLVSSTTWLLSGAIYAVSAGFSVQVAHQIGGNHDKKARDVVLAVVEAKKIEETRYLENIRKWHKDCWWRHEKWRDGKRIVYYGMVGVKEIADLLFGIENNGSITIVDGNSKKLYAEVAQRISSVQDADRTLEIRCAMISFVVSGISVRNAFRIFASVAVSTALVLSSRISTFGFFSSALAIQRRCF